MDRIKQVSKWPELQTTGDPDFELLVVRVTWLFSWRESAIIAQGYISFGEFATKATSKLVIQGIKSYSIISRISLQW